MSQPDALVEYALASTAAHVVSQAFVEADGERLRHRRAWVRSAPAPSSSGSGSAATTRRLARNDDYWDKANGGPYLDEVVIKILPEPTTRVAGLETGEIDYLLNDVPSDQYATVAGHGPTSTSPSCPRTTASGSRSTRPSRRSTTSRSARRSTTRSTRPACASSTRPGHARTPRRRSSTRRSGPSSRPQWEAAWEELPAYDQDLEMARQLLDESGVADQLNGKTIAYYESTPSIKGIGESFIDVMSQLGITIEAQKIDLPRGDRAPVRGPRRLRHHRRRLGLRLPRPVGQPAPELRIREHRGRRRQRVLLLEPAGRRAARSSRTRSPTGRSGRASSSRPRRSSPRTRRSSR